MPAKRPGTPPFTAAVLATAVIAAGAAALRFAVSLDDFGLDETRSLFFARTARGAGDILFRVRHDNNHFLNTLMLHWIGVRESQVPYRLPAVVSGTLSVLAAWHIGMKKGTACGVVTAGAFAVSYLHVLYGTEARGYSPAILFALLAWGRIIRWQGRPSPLETALITGIAILGSLSHLVFVLCFVMQAVWSGLDLLLGGRSFRDSLRACLLTYGPSAAFIALFYFLCVRGMDYGGGFDGQPRARFPVVFETTVQTSAIALGLPETGDFALLAPLLVAVICLSEWVLTARDRDRGWMLEAGVVAIAPAVLSLTTPVWTLAPRYHMMAITFFVLVAGRFAARMWRRGGAARVIGLAVAALFVTGNLYRDFMQLKVGRSGYSRAVRDLGAMEESDVIVLGSDHDYRMPMILSWHSRFLPAGKRIEYLNQGDWPPEGPRWFIVHYMERDRTAPPELNTILAGQKFVLISEYRGYGMSGLDWFVYRRVTPGR